MSQDSASRGQGPEARPPIPGCAPQVGIPTSWTQSKRMALASGVFANSDL